MCVCIIPRTRLFLEILTVAQLVKVFLTQDRTHGPLLLAK